MQISRNVFSASALPSAQKHTLPELDFDFKALEPIISGQIMEVHHQKHHQAYITNFNAAEVQLQEALHKNDTSKIIALQGALKFNGGGHINHSIFWKNLSPKKSSPSSDLQSEINNTFGSFDNFKKEFTAATVAVQGSGWGWLGFNKKTNKVQIATCFNQDPLEATTGTISPILLSFYTCYLQLFLSHIVIAHLNLTFNAVNQQKQSIRILIRKILIAGLVPLLGVDVWEHAYYLQYKNLRLNYVEAIFDVVNWDDVSARLAAAKAK